MVFKDINRHVFMLVYDISTVYEPSFNPDGGCIV